FIGNIWIIHINPIPHLLGEIIPNIGIAHYCTFTCFIIFFNTYFCAYIFFCDPKFFFNSQFYGKAMGIPPGFSLYLVTFLGFITTKYILDGTGHNMVNSGQSICRRRAFEKHKWLLSFTGSYALFKYVILLPIG